MQVRSNSNKMTKIISLKSRRDFLRVQRSGGRFRGKFIVFMTRPSSQVTGGRLGLVAPKAIGKAHDRNFVKRRLRHIISIFPEILSNNDVVLLANAESVCAGFEELKNDLLNASRQRLVQPGRNRGKKPTPSPAPSSKCG